jgi:bla regulator protein blaR1
MNTGPIAEFLRQLGAASVQASGLAIVVWMACAVLGRHLSPRWRCLLWSLVIVRLGWPFSIPSEVSLFNLWAIPRRFTPTDWVPCYLPEELSNAAKACLNRAWVIWVWMAVSTVLLLHWSVTWYLSVQIRRNARPVRSWKLRELLHQCLETTHTKAPVPLLESSRVAGPCLVGWIQPCLLIPTGLVDELSENELKLVFFHELAHLRRRDVAVNWVLSAVQIFHWFNPLVWLVARELRTAREEACDAAALATIPGANRSYGETLIKMLERPSPPLEWAHFAPSPGLTSMVGNSRLAVSPLAQRLRAISRFRPGARTWVVGACTWLALACIGFTDAEPPAATDGPDPSEIAPSTASASQSEAA